jgi:predicted MPP superfamily phosphohydrolase
MSKTLTWLHLSDIHFRQSDEWRDGNNRDSFLEYLGSVFSQQPELKPDLIFCTGDIAFGEEGKSSLESQYLSAEVFFDELLKICADGGKFIDKNKLFFVPGNHDINRKKVNKDAQAFFAQQSDGKITANLINTRFEKRETEFLDAMRRLEEYYKFVKEYLPHQDDIDGRGRYASVLEIHGKKVGIAGFNSAWTCAGPEDDRNIWLAAEWQFNQAKKIIKDADLRIGLIHHPTDWLSLPDRDLTTIRIASDFDFWLHGHTHNSWVTPTQSHAVIAAGAVGAQSSEEFGFNITSIDLDTHQVITHLHTRKSGSDSWTIAPVSKHAPDGKWRYPLNAQAIAKLGKPEPVDKANNVKKSDFDISNNLFIARIFEKRLADSLRSFSTYSSTWVNRVISTVSEVVHNAETAPTLELSDLIQNPRSAVIKAPAQYGLTCLSHYLISECWKKNSPELYLYMDTKSVAPNNSAIENFISDELQLLNIGADSISGIILDSWSIEDKDSIKLLELISKKFKELPIIIMQYLGSGSFNPTLPIVQNRQFEEYFLWALSRNVMRNMVALYNEKKTIGDEDAVTARLASDLDVLNLHRTPLNCITLLKVSEIDFDENPVNRSEMIKRVLFLLFNVDEIPNYKSKPDLKDCEYVLGRFCETLIRSGNFTFARDKFLAEIQSFCQDSLIDLDIYVVFDVLFNNNIIVKSGKFFTFKFAYWVYYFAAQRMSHDEGFAEYIFEDMRYSRFPEIIEFYTGTDRRRNDALNILIRDLNASRIKVKDNLGLPDDVNPYKFSVWVTNDNVKSQMRKEIADGVKDSNLPASIKDRYADQAYNIAKPYNQNIQDLFSQYSFLTMLRVMSAAARALRNSDYAEPEIKKQLLREITGCWSQATRALFVVLPLLAQKGYASYDGMGFELGNGFGESDEERFINVLGVIPFNVMRWSRDDLYSRKMGPLLINRIKQIGIDSIEKHELMLLLIDTRPRNWEDVIEAYIVENTKNSFYLLDVYKSLRTQHKVGYFSSNASKHAVENLIKICSVKHVTGEKKPTEKSMKGLIVNDSAQPVRREIKGKVKVSNIFSGLLKKIADGEE